MRNLDFARCGVYTPETGVDMKRIALVLYSCFLFLFLFVGCATSSIDTALLRPSGIKVNPLLPRLDISNDKKVSFSSADTNLVTENSYFYTIFERELETNICDDYGEKLGSIELVLIDNRIKETGLGFSVLSGFTLFIPNLVGMPMDSFDYSLEFEIRIFANNGERVWKHAYSSQGRVYSVIFNGFKSWSTDDQLKQFKELLEQCKRDLSRDSSLIRTRLDENK